MKKICVVIIILSILFNITLTMILNNSSYAVVNKMSNMSTEVKFQVQIDGVYENDIDGYHKYNTLFIDMNLLKSLLINKGANVTGNTYSINEMQLIIDEENNNISIPDIYSISNICINYNSTKVDSIDLNDTVDIEIENFNNKKYIPLYLISNINKFNVKLEGEKIYDSANYINAVEAIKNQDNNYNLEITTNNNEVNRQSSYLKWDIDGAESTRVSTDATNPYYYKGLEDGALWREEAYKRIEKNRKKDIKIVVKDKNNNIIPNAKIDISMNTNDFKFGATISENNKDLFKNVFDGISKTYFNSINAANMFKWSREFTNTSPFKDVDILKQYRMEIADYAKNKLNGAAVHGHTLWWDKGTVLNGKGSSSLDIIGTTTDTDIDKITMGYIIREYEEYLKEGISSSDAINRLQPDIKKLKERFENLVYNHIKEEIEENPNVDSWDIFNELVTCGYYKYYIYNQKMFKKDSTGKYQYTLDNDASPAWKENEFVKDNEYVQFLAKAIKVAKNTANEKNPELVIADYALDGRYTSVYKTKMISLIKAINEAANELQEEVDAIGIHYHSKTNYFYTPQSYYNNINQIVNETGVSKVKITEYDNINSILESKSNIYSQSNPNTDINAISAEEEKTRAAYLRDSLINTFSNKYVNEFILWTYNFSFKKDVGYSTDSDAYKLFTESEKRAYEEFVYDKLNYKENGETNTSGAYDTRLYNGSYNVIIEYGGESKEIKIETDKDINELEVILDTESPEFVKGDINGDGKISIKDWNRMYEYINGTSELSDDELARGDVNGDGKVNIKDWNKMYEHITEVDIL